MTNRLLAAINRHNQTHRIHPVKRLGRAATLAVFLAGAWSVTWAQPSLDLDIVGRWPASALAQMGYRGQILVAGPRAYVGTVSGLQVIDIADPANPRFVGNVDGVSVAGSLRRVGDYLYVATEWECGLYVVDLRNPDRPVVTGTWVNRWTSGIRGLDVAGRYAYVADEGVGLQVIDVSNPTHPVKVGDYDRFLGYEVSVAGGLAYVVAVRLTTGGVEEILSILDIRDPLRPVVVGECFVESAHYVRMRLHGGFVYVASQGLEIIDVRVPTSPKSVRLITMDDYVSDLAVEGTNCWLATTAGIVRVDVSNPAQAVVLDRFADGAWEAIAIEGNQLYVGGNPFRVFDVTDPADPRPQGVIVAEIGSAEDLQLYGDRLYVADGHAGLQIVSCADPAQPMTLGSLSDIGRAERVRVNGDTALIVCSSTVSNYVVVADVANPAQPLALSTFTSSGGPIEDLALRDGYAYLTESGWSSPQMEVFDVRDRENPIPVRQVLFAIDFTWWAPGSLQLVETNAFVLLGTDYGGWQPSYQSMGVVDIRDPPQARLASIVHASALVGSAEIKDFSVSAGHAFLACGGDGLRILDIRNLSEPACVGTLAVDGSVSLVAVDEGYAYLMGDRWAGCDTEDVIRVVDVRNPAEPMLVAVYGQTAKALLPKGDWLYLALGGRGVQVARLPGPLEILAQPQDAAVATGGTVSLSVQAFGGSSLSYQWYRGAMADTSQPVPGATRASYSAASTAEPTQYWVRVSGPEGATNSRTATVSSRRPVRLDFLGEWPGTPRGSAVHVAVEGSLAYVASGAGGLHIFDVASPSSPQWLGAVKPFAAAPTTQYGNVGIESQLLLVAGAGDYAHAIGDHGLTIIDVTQPASPRVASQYVAEWEPGGIALKEGVAFLGLGYGLEVVDVHDPLHPRQLSPPGERPDGIGGGRMPVDVVDHFAYWLRQGVDPVTWRDRTEWAISDISTPANPIHIGTFPTAGYVRAARARDQLALVFESVYTNDIYVGNLLEVFTLTNPAAPVRMGSFDVADWIAGIDIDNAWGYLATDRGLDVIDLATPSSPRFAAHLPLNGRPQGVLVRDGVAYVAAGEAGLMTVSVADPEHPVILGSGSTGGGASCLSASLVGTTAIVADGSGGLQLLDVSNPTNSVSIGGYVTSNRVVEVRSQGDLVFVAEEPGGNGECAHLRVFRLSDPASPTLLGDYTMDAGTLAFDVVGSFAYVATLFLDHSMRMYRPALEVVDLARPSEPRLRGRCVFLSYAGGRPGVAVARNHAFVTLGDTGLAILDISAPERPLHLASFPSGYALYRLRVVGSHAYVVGVRGSEPRGALLVLDISVPDVPRCVAVLDLGVDAEDIYVYSHYALVAAGEEGVVVVDISDPEHPVKVGRGSMRGLARGVFMSSGTLVAAGGAYGISLFELSPWLELHLAPVGAGQGALSWRGGSGIRVQQSGSLTSPAGWSDLPGTDGASNALVPLDGPGTFFRLIAP